MSRPDAINDYLSVDEGFYALRYFTATASLPPPPSNTNNLPSPKIDIDKLLSRVSKLENELFQCESVDESMRRARNVIVSPSSSYFSAKWKWVPPEYYSLPLSQRAKILGAHSIHQLCKSLLMENKAYSAERSSTTTTHPPQQRDDRTYSRFYLIVIQYAATLNTSKLETEIRALRPFGSNRLDPSKFDFRIATEDDNEMITGYSHNSVTPFGMLQNVPIVLSKAVTEVRPKFMWMGGGHVNLKLGLSVDEFVKGTDAIVADVSDARSGNEDSL